MGVRCAVPLIADTVVKLHVGVCCAVPLIAGTVVNTSGGVNVNIF